MSFIFQNIVGTYVMNNILVKNNMSRFLYFVLLAIFISGVTKTNARNIDHEGIQRDALFPKSADNRSSKSEEMCKRYITEACKTRVSRSTSTSNSSGISETTTFIIGGEETDPKEHPHMALVGVSKRKRVDWICGGSLISKNFVLTAAHCTKPYINTIRLGELNLASVHEDAKETDFKITSMIVHPDYGLNDDKYPKNDIALLKFRGVPSFNEYIRPICLNTVFDIPDQKFIAVGWGDTEEGGEKGNKKLRKVNLNLQENKKCISLYGKRSFNSKRMLCVGYAPGGKDTCQGDSGGPLQIKNEITECPKKVPTYTQIGITSFGKGCARRDTPGVYTRVSDFIPWIESHVWK